jgi:hypothetical protein
MNTKFTLSLEQLDKRDMPSAVGLAARPPLHMEEMRVEIPEGCWPGPRPDYANDSIIVLGGSPAAGVQKVTPGEATGEIIPIGGAAAQKAVNGR